MKIKAFGNLEGFSQHFTFAHERCINDRDANDERRERKQCGFIATDNLIVKILSLRHVFVRQAGY